MSSPGTRASRASCYFSWFLPPSSGIAGVAAPFLFGKLIGDGSDPGPLTIGYYVGAVVMLAGGIIAWFFGVDAERKSLEDISDPLSAVRKSTPGATRFEGPTPLTR